MGNKASQDIKQPQDMEPEYYLKAMDNQAGSRDQQVVEMLGDSNQKYKVIKQLKDQGNEQTKHVQDDDGERLPHIIFSSLLSTCKKKMPLFKISDPESERYLEFVEPHKKKGINGIKLELDYLKKSWCHDSYFKESMFDKKMNTLDNLKANISKYVDWKSIESSQVVTEENIQFFEQTLSKEDARACLYALIFYTGSGSEYANAGAAIEIRKANETEFENAYEKFKSENYASIIYYLILALNQIEFYWGQVERWINLSEENNDFEIYKRGNVVTWIQFSSSAMTEGDIHQFKSRNSKFYIWSIKGRDISRFSTFTTEKEVLFTPFSRFLILDIKKEKFKNENGQWHHYTAIYMREIEVGLFDCKPVLWVDDEIFNSQWENKQLMQKAQSKVSKNIRFICKPSTDLANAFLKSMFGQRLLNNPEFRIVSDMNRDTADAGAIFMKKAIDLGFVLNKKLIFTSDQEKGRQKCEQKGIEMDEQMMVTHSYAQALKFIQYD